MQQPQSYGTLIQRNANQAEREHLAITINSMLESWTPHLPRECCIYKVPYHLRKLNEEAYTPQVISVGPIHRQPGNQKLQILEKYKLRYLRNFIIRAQTNLVNLVSIVKDSEERIRQCYAETIELDSDEFVKMILLDAAFIIEYFLKNMFPEEWTDEDRIVIKPWITARMQLDFLLLENQIPLFIVQELYEPVWYNQRKYRRRFFQVAFHYFGFLNTQNKSSDSGPFNILHFVDLIRIFYLPPLERTLSERQPNSRAEKIYPATQLAEAGLIFKKSESLCYLDIKYKDGVLEIPRFTIDNTTEIYARNLMALEQCHYPREAYITDYFFMLDFLIDTDKDVALLARKKILVNGLGDDNATFINNLGTNVQYSSMNADYCRLCSDLVQFHDRRRHRWKASLKRDYFKTPWSIVSFIAAVILLAMTITQAVCAIISVLPSKRRNL